MAAKDKEFDIVIFGASGFTGKFVIEELSRVANEHNIKWAIAGRNMKKLETVLSDVTNSTGQDYSDIQILIADSQNYESLLEMCTKAKCLINCCGPFVYHGLKVLEACIECKTHHVDVSGEPLFLEKAQLQYNGPAQENDVYIVGSCAFRCLPIDIGIMYTSQQFNGDLNNVEAYLSVDGPVKVGLPTFECQVYGYQHRNELGAIRKSLFTTKNYEFQHVVKPKSGLFYDKDSSKYCSVWPDAYKSVAYRSQRFLQDQEKKRPTQYAFYFCNESLIFFILMFFSGLCLSFLSRFSLGRKLLLAFPTFFSGGLVKKGGPTKQELEKCSFSLKFCGNGYPSRVKELTDTHSDLPNKPIVTKINGPDPGYLTTAICVTQAAIVILEENQKMPNSGGVFTPASAFANTSLVERLCKRNVKFQTVSADETSPAAGDN
ncbi:saccharopine dehydrogenase-like oxidoreductase [Octopus sinensis]|uniref:Saccharopine dehydrogenase-like oxidoreductase n=1 Tax=Octopus sinensis TaxID=2607531 RepID=A0A6P7SBJ5_9MOLL|nr:saccharopine dehydrogenase-like oxidoreductase [Octopus sinensis]